MKGKITTIIHNEINNIKTNMLSISIVVGLIFLLGIALIVSTLKVPDNDSKPTDIPSVPPPVASPSSSASPSFSEDLLSSHSTLRKQTYNNEASSDKANTESQPFKDDIDTPKDDMDTPIVEPRKSIKVPLPVKGAKDIIEVAVLGENGCGRKDLVDLAWDISALLGEGSLTFMCVGCRSGKMVSFDVDAEVPWSIRSAAFNELPLRLLSISRRISMGYPQENFSIGWSVKKDRRSEHLATYTNYPNVYEGFTFLDRELVKKGKYPTGCKPGLEEKIVAIVAKRTGLKSFAWGWPFIISCHGKPMWGLALDFPIENVAPPFTENKILPHCESLFRDLENEAGEPPGIIPLVVRSENLAVGQLFYFKGRIDFMRIFSDAETLKRKALIYRIEKEEKKREQLEFIIAALQN